MPKPLNRSAWLKRQTPGPKDRHIESAWLDEHYLYGGRVHEITADALVDALRVGSVREVGHALHLKLFAEYANALEVAGAWGWVLRTRRRQPLLMDAFLTYGPEAPGEFYAAARRSRGSVARLLDLPAEAQVIDALAHAFPDASDDDLRGTLGLCVGQAKLLARDYFELARIIPRIFNRTKHGATLMHDESLSVREYRLVSPHVAISSPADRKRYELAKFTVDRKSVEGVRSEVGNAAALIRFLSGLAKGLNDAGVLYPPRHPLVRGGIPARIPRPAAGPPR